MEATKAVQGPLDGLYNADPRDTVPFGAHWCGPLAFRHAEPTLVARYPKDGSGDGQDVEVYCDAWPARFYKLRVAAGANSVGEPQGAYEIVTGSGMANAAAVMAEGIAAGMIGFRAARKEG